MTDPSTIGKIAEAGVNVATGGESGIIKKAVSTTGTAAKGALWATGSAGVKALGTLSFLLALLGLAQYFIRVKLQIPTLTITISLILFFMGGYVLAKRAGKDSVATIIPMIIFMVWYFPFRSTIDLNGNFITFVIVSILIYFGVMIITKGESIKAEVYGLFPGLIFFLDIGFLPWLNTIINWPITPFTESLLLFMPWWFFFGIFTLPLDATESRGANIFINLIRILGIVFVVFSLIAPALPTVGYDKGLLPSATELEQAQARLRAESGYKTNPALLRLSCLWDFKISNLDECAKNKQIKAEAEYNCKRIRNIEPTDSQWSQCVKEETDKINKKSASAIGVRDTTIDIPTKAEFILDKNFPSNVNIREGSSQRTYPIELKITNPRQQTLTYEAVCNFISTKNKETKVKGQILSSGKFLDKLIMTVIEPTKDQTISCKPSQALNGVYTLEYNVTLKNLNTKSQLARAFIGKKTSEEKKELILDIKKAHFPSSISTLTKSALDFARLNFAFGNSVNNAIIEKGDVQITSSIENLGQGRITAIHSYQINLPGFTSIPDRCITGNNVDIPRNFLKTLYLDTCSLTLPSDLENPNEYTFRWFTAEINYDYMINKKVPITVRVIK